MVVESGREEISPIALLDNVTVAPEPFSIGPDFLWQVADCISDPGDDDFFSCRKIELLRVLDTELTEEIVGQQHVGNE